ncbi:MAG TPA: murein biosynthesis integral membrane protein MurJ [Casimicrobiaceae bacterium]
MNLLKALSTVSAMTLLSRITGLARESLKAVVFGAGLQMDAFEAAFRLPNILRRLFGEGAFSQAFVPILAECKRQRGEEATRDLVGKVGALLALVLLIVSVLGVLAAPWLVYLLAGGFVRTPGKVELTADMIRIMFPYILFISLVSLAGGVLNVYRRFAIPAFTPVVLNVSIIGAALFVAPHVDPPIVALAWGVAIGGVAQLALQFRPLAKLGILPSPRLVWRDPDVRRVLSAMGPALLGVSAAQISVLINTQLAAYLGDGRISWITYADRLMEFPSALLGAALGTILLPSLAQHYHDENPGQYRELLDWGLRVTFLLALPAALALALLAAPLIATLYQYGRFSVNDVWQTRPALLGYSVGLLGLITVKILAPGFYARHDMKTPVRAAFLSLVVAQTLAVVLMFQIGHAGLTLATSTGATLNAWLLYRALRRGDIYTPLPGWGRFLGRIAVALVVLGAVLWWSAGPDELWTRLGLVAKVSRLAWVVGAGAITYFATLRLLGFRLADLDRREP